MSAKISGLILLAVATGAWAADVDAPATKEAVGRYATRVTTDRVASGYRNVACASEPGIQIAVSSHSYRSGAMIRDESVCPLNRPFISSRSLTDGWASSEYEHLPQWVWIHFPSPRRIDKVVLYATTLATSPVEFSGQYLHDGGARFDTLFYVQEARFDPQKLSCTVGFKPVVASGFRLLLQRSPASITNQSWVARLTQVEVYGDDATNAAQKSIVATPGKAAADLDSHLKPTKFAPEVRDTGSALAISTPWYRLVLDKARPRITRLSWDSLGQGELGVNFLQPSGACPVFSPLFQKPLPLGPSTLTRTGNLFHYSPVEVAPGAYEQVSIRADERGFALGLAAKANQTLTMRGGLFRFNFAVIQALFQTGQYDAAERLLWPLIGSFEKGTFNAGVQLPKQKQRNPVGSAFYVWDGSRGRGEGYLPENWDGLEALFTGHFGIGFDQDGYYLESWSPLKGQRVKLDLPYMGKNIEYVTRSK